MNNLPKELIDILKNTPCLGCSKGCDLDYPMCERGNEKAKKIIEEFLKDIKK